jgi:hypothetical protein
MGLTGKQALQARMKAITADNLFLPVGKEWAEECARLMRERVPNRNTRWSTGRLHDSIRPRKSRAKQKVVVDAAPPESYFVDAGTQGHGISSRMNRTAARGTIFAPKARKAHGYPARPYRTRSAKDALAKVDMSQEVIDLWNRAA